MSNSNYKVAAVSLNQTPLDWEGNLSRIRQGLKEARARNAKVVLFPELAITGYGCEDLFFYPEVENQSVTSLHSLLEDCKGCIAIFGLPVRYHGTLYNCAAVVLNQKLIGIVAKQNLAGYGLHYEPRWFSPWLSGEVGEITLLGSDVPFGDLLFRSDKFSFGIEICHDAWMRPRPAASLVSRGASLILNPSASHFEFEKLSVRHHLIAEVTRNSNVSYAYANLVGNEAGRSIYDGGSLIYSSDLLLAEGERFSLKEVEVVTATICLEPKRVDSPTAVDFSPPEQSAEPRTEQITPSSLSKNDEFSKAVSLGLFDYCRKSSSDGFVISLSGGADSAAVTLLAWFALRRGFYELGIEELTRRFRPSEVLHSCKSFEDIAPKMITCLYQSSENSSDITKCAASALARSLGVSFESVDISNLIADYTALTEKVIHRSLNWEEDDRTLQNIQARVRAPSVWMIANAKNALLLSTSNRSEASVGYTTMDGDSAGGLCPIAGIDKPFIRNWLSHIEKEGLGDVPPIDALRMITEQEPTAELRPASIGQSDEEDLMPYEVLDYLERAFILHRKMPSQVLSEIEAAFPNRDREIYVNWITRFYQLLSRNQWKRERFAPSFHIDTHNVDPRTWFRFPILTGGFRKELEQLSTAKNTVSKNK